MLHQFSEEYARIFGLREAIVMQFLKDRINKNPYKGIDGKRGAQMAQHEISFALPFFSLVEVNNIMKSLERQGVIDIERWLGKGNRRIYSFANQKEFL